MDRINHDIVVNALLKANPELASVIDFIKDKNSNNDRVKTFEDCARVEQDIMSKLNSAIPFQ